MTELIQLFIGSQEVEFSHPLDILYNYPITELQNPTVVKNSFSKTITIEGTPSNNQLFGHFWSVERLQNNSMAGNGVYFNASRKVPFVIYVNSEIYEQGYVKFDNVVNNNGIIQYQITLYGGLGDFFYMLKSTEDGQPKKLSDLDFGVNLDFKVNAKNVFEAWQNLNDFEGWDEWMEWLYPEIERNDKWEIINFMPSYNGLPDEFESNKVIIDTTDSYLNTYKVESGITYTSKDGYIMGELNEELTEWDVRDLRSYLQRPCIRMKAIVNACCNPDNNGGYQVELDPDFFNENNPYWEKTWLSLPMMQNLEYTTSTQILEDSKLVGGSFTEDSKNDGDMYQDLHFDIGNFTQQVPEYVTVCCNIRTSSTPRPYTTFLNFSDTTYTKGYKGRICYGSLFVQLLAFNGETVVAASEAYNLSSRVRAGGKLFYGTNDNYEDAHKFKPYMNKSIVNKLGWFSGGYWCYEDSSTPIDLYFHLKQVNQPITGLKLYYFWGASEDKRKLVGVNQLFDKAYQVGKSYQIQPSSVDMKNFEFKYVDSDIKAELSDNLGRTGTQVTKEMLLNTESSPCDYLLSYAKMFGLYFRKDVENNTIYIETRKTFYDRTNVFDLSQYIDKSKEIEIKPLSFDTKWYEFKQESDKSDFKSKYFSSKGVEYGSKILNTGYEFIADRKNLLEENCIKSGIEGLERSKWFTTYSLWDDKYRPWFENMKYKLYSGNNSIDMDNISGAYSLVLQGSPFGINDGANMKYYDLFPKLQFHDAKNSPVDGNNVLVFFSGFKNVTTDRILPLHYNLSDDNKYQAIFNDGNPCWLFSKAEIVDAVRICYKLGNIPVFERYLTEQGGNKVKKSLDFGTAQELYVPNYSIDDNSNIYTNFWKSYLEDLYDVNTRILICYVRVVGKPNPSWLQRFYWFDNAIWRLNNIIDWNISSYDTVKMEFVKVHDLEDYTSITQTRGSTIKMYSSTYNISANGEEFNLTIENENPNNLTWRLLNPQSDNTNDEDNFVVTSRSAGVGNGQVTVTSSANNNDNGRNIYFTVVNEEGQMANVTIYQKGKNETHFNVQPSNIIIGGNEGNTEVFFSWYNQLDNNVNSYLDEGPVDIKSIDFNNTINKAVINYGSNNGNTIWSEKITFTSGTFESVFGIDQLPNLLEFDKDGTQIFTLSFTYNKPNFTELPYWINLLKVSDYEYKIMAKPNYYKQIQEGIIKVNGNDLVVRQEEGEGIGGTQESTVNPNSLYFDKNGGTQFIVVNTSKNWRIENDGWVSLSQRQGNGSSIISVSVGVNDNVSRTSIIKVICEDKTINVVVTQTGTITTPTFSLNPSSVTIGKDGGVVRATFTYKDKGTDYVTVNGNEVSIGQIIWYGEEGYVDITVPKNMTISSKVYEIVFTTSIGDYIFTITQDAGDSYISVSNLSLKIGYEGGTITNTISSNTSWTVINDADWFTISPLSGNGNQTIVITVQPNTVQTDRESVVNLFTVDNKTASFKVSQRKFIPTLSITPSSITFDSNGGTATIKIKSNTDWEIEL